jgi:CxxC motif-containing protein (DUF1111 family)
MQQRSVERSRRSIVSAVAAVVWTLVIVAAVAADDPPKPGDPLPGLTTVQLNEFTAGKEEFETTEEADEGLGPVFNNSSCATCHASPATGGDSNILETRFGRMKDGTFDPMADQGGSLIQTDGIDPAHGCAGEKVPADATVVAQRKSTPLFGLGLVDRVPDSTLQDLAARQRRLTPEQAGTAAIVRDAASGQDRVGRFGWKAQVATLLTFSADAYLNEMGITSPIFPKENLPGGDAGLLERCDKVPDVEDDGTDVAAFTDFMSRLAPPARGPAAASVGAGAAVFGRAGCDVCHVKELITGPGDVAAMDRVRFEPFSDFLLHDMGSLGDGIVQGPASGTQMKTAPLWGLRLRSRYLHDGRATTVADAIAAHDGQGAAARDAFAQLKDTDRQRLLDFLGSL